MNPIRKQIDSYYQKMQEAIDPSTFELQSSYLIYKGKILELQKQCKHNFKNGKCEFCDKEENECS